MMWQIDAVIGAHMSKIADPESASVIIRSLCEMVRYGRAERSGAAGRGHQQAR